jgi:ribosome silencing factor RsfS/YbeB/iojap
VEDLVELLRRENAIDLCVIKVSPQMAYVDYMVIATGSTYRHMLGVSSFVRKVYKLKRHKNDPIPKIEGENCTNWMAMDLGNIALHIFSKKAREYYNLESLWLLGEEYEKKVKGRDAPDELYEQFFTTSQPLPIEEEEQQQQQKSEAEAKL